MEEDEDLVFNTFYIPPMPKVAARILKGSPADEMSVSEIVKILGTDPGLTARALRLANSAMFSPSRRIRSLREAVVTLGFRTVRKLAITDSMRFLRRQPGPVQDNLWRHSVSVAVCASCIGGKHTHISSEECFTSGILHDVGKFILNNHDSSRFKKALELCSRDGLSSVAAEIDIFGFDHTTVGTAVLRRWRLPETLAGVVRFHQNVSMLKNSSPETRLLAACVNLANRVSHILKFGLEPPYVNSGNTQESSIGLLGLDMEEVIEAINDARLLYREEIAVLA